MKFINVFVIQIAVFLVLVNIIASNTLKKSLNQTSSQELLYEENGKGIKKIYFRLVKYL